MEGGLDQGDGDKEERCGQIQEFSRWSGQEVMILNGKVKRDTENVSGSSDF